MNLGLMKLDLFRFLAGHSCCLLAQPAQNLSNFLFEETLSNQQYLEACQLAQQQLKQVFKKNYPSDSYWPGVQPHLSEDGILEHETCTGNTVVSVKNGEFRVLRRKPSSDYYFDDAYHYKGLNRGWPRDAAILWLHTDEEEDFCSAAIFLAWKTREHKAAQDAVLQLIGNSFACQQAWYSARVMATRALDQEDYNNLLGLGPKDLRRTWDHPMYLEPDFGPKADCFPGDITWENQERKRQLEHEVAQINTRESFGWANPLLPFTKKNIPTGQ